MLYFSNSQMTHTGGVWLPQLGYNKQWWSPHHTKFPTYLISVTYSTTKIQNFVFYSCEKPLTWGDQLPLLQLGHVGQCRCPQLVFPTFSHELSSLLFVTLLNGACVPKFLPLTQLTISNINANFHISISSICEILQIPPLEE